MRLTSIKLAGFKSFVDSTHLPLPSNLTSIVGPNGCGKSNIIDAVRWVLGEASIKNLRAAEADDVIFNGSKTRKPVGRASVELLFDNADQQILGPYAAYTDIAVKRELTRDGNSQYFLNGKKCLKRDVTDLFLGTGLGGKNQYAIIEQGMVSRMVEAKPEELRLWLEEAAGISKYKERRRETESRIKQTRENLSRLSDLRSELHSRVEVLAKQAANAEKFKEYKGQERRQRAELLSLKLSAAQLELARKHAAISLQETQFEAARAQVVEAYANRQTAEAGIKAEQEQLNSAQGKVYEAEAVLARADQALRHALELKNLKSRELEQLARQLAELSSRQAREQARQGQLAQELAALEQQLAAAETEEGNALAAASAAEAAVSSAQSAWNEHLAKAEAPLSQVEAERVRSQQLDRARLMSEERHKRLSSEQSTIDLAPLQASLVDVDAELTALSGQLAEASSALASQDAALVATREARTQLETALHEDRQALQSAKGRLASLETLQQAALKQDDAEVNQWLKSRSLSAEPRLAGLLQVANGWEAAVEAVLGDWLQAPVTGALAALLDATGPKPGLVAVANGEGYAHPDASRLAHHITGPAAVLDTLSGVYVATDAASAIARLPSLLDGESVITPDGIWRARHWLRWPKTGAANSGVIARGQLLKQLKIQQDQLQASVSERETQLNTLRGEQQQLETQRRELAQQLEQRRLRQSQRQTFRQTQQLRLEQAQNRLAQLGQELTQLADQQSQQSQELAHARARLSELEAIALALRSEREGLNMGLAKARDALARARAALQGAQQTRNAFQLKVASQKSAAAALVNTLEDLAQRLAVLTEQQGSQSEQAQALDAPLENQQQAVEAARLALSGLRDGLRSAREAMQKVEASFSQCQQAAHSAEFAQDAARDALQTARLEAEGEKVREATLAEQVGETGFNAEELKAQLPETATAAEWEERLGQTTRRIERLGAINLAAIQELEEGRTRAEYLDAQDADLVSALSTLEEAMGKIDGETRELFRATFDKVNTVFIDRFPKLFGGGEAYLELTGESQNDLALNPNANWGVRVMARPPGKRNSTIQLLSGGEKAMTAVALLLALFQLNPAPFCLMDEVDAPLDDANVVRFCDIVKEMSQGVQFIIITHNKITMELANQLHGVTMQEPGVSRLVSVDLAKAMELTAEDNASEMP